MRMNKKTGCVLNGSRVPEFPKAPRSARRRNQPKRAIENNNVCAFELLASLAGKLLEETETSSASSNGSDGHGHSAFGGNVGLHSQDVDKMLKSLDHGSSEASVFVSELAAEKCNLNCAHEELPHGGSDSSMECTSTVATSACSGRVNCDAKSVDTKVEEVSGIVSCKLEEASSNYGEHCNRNIGKGTGGQFGVYMGGFDNLANAKSESPKDDTTNMYKSAELPLPRDPHRNDGVLKNRDDDENISGSRKFSTKYKGLKQPARIGNRRIRKLLTSKYWQGVPKLKDYEPSTNKLLHNDGRCKAIYPKRKRCYNHEKCNGGNLYKKRKLVDQSSLFISNGGSSGQSVSNSPEKVFNRDSNAHMSTSYGVDCLPSSATAHQPSIHSKESPVKFSIKSFKVPELYIEVPESTTVGSLKRTIREAVTSLLGDGLRVGILYQGKKVRDDNRTLMQAGITCKQNLDMLGFTLEPNHGKEPPPLHAKNSPLLCGDPQTSNRSISAPKSETGASNASSEKPLSLIMGDCLASNPEQVSLQTDVAAEKATEDSKALVSVPAVSVDALSIVPMNQKTKNSENAQRRTRRPFSVAEVEALVKAVEELGTGRWRDIKLRAFDNSDHRTYVDLKDKWKTLVHTAQISPQQRRGEPVPQDILERVLNAHTYWSQHQVKAHGKNKVGTLKNTVLGS